MNNFSKQFLALAFLSIISLSSSLSVLAKKSQPELTYKNLNQLILSGQPSHALEYLKVFKTKKSKDVWLARLQFVTAYLYFRAEDFEKAAKYFKEIQGTYPPLNEDIDFYLALALRNSGKAKEAIDILEKLKSQNISVHLAPSIERELALSYCKAGDRGTGIDKLNALIQSESSEAKTYHLRFDRAQCLLMLGDHAEAAASLKLLYLNYPQGDLGAEIRAALAQLGKAQGLSASEHLQRAATLMSNKRPDLAVFDLEAAQENYGGAAPLTLKRDLATAYFKARKYREAAHVFEELRREDPNFNQQDLEQLAQAYSRSDQFNKAIETYQNILQTKPATEQANFEYKIAFLTMDRGDYQEANQKFLELLARYPQFSKKSAIRWYIAWNYYLLGQYDQALNALDILESEFPRSDEAKRIPYWRARILEKQGHEAQAKAAYQAIAQNEIFSYYGFLSLKRLSKKITPELPPQDSWMHDLPHSHLPAPFSVGSLDAKGKQSLEKIKELLIVGLWEDFLTELEQLTAREGIAGDLNYQNSTSAGMNANNENDTTHWTNQYPPAYSTLVSLFAQSRDLPIALVWGIMREESRFRPEVVSPANAIGLMQIIPPTGEEIAQDLGRKGFVPENLYQPAVNIEYGVHYLSKNLHRFDNNPIYTIASYNAGPEAVERWLKSRPNREWDEFVEEIPYSETNNYVKKVLKSYYIYSLMYSS